MGRHQHGKPADSKPESRVGESQGLAAFAGLAKPQGGAIAGEVGAGSAGRRAPRVVRKVGTFVLIGCAAVMLFARLGHYALWDDEAGTALVAKAILRTSDTSAMVDGHNVFAYRNGGLLKGLKIRYWPPLQAYLAAPFLAVFGEESAFAARLPFALCGLGTVALMAWWLWRGNVSNRFGFLVIGGLLCNVSFFLYSRQCRYYGPAFLLSAAVACVYLRWTGRRSRLVLLAILSILLLATNYLSYIALCVALLVDYALWGRERHAMSRRDWMILLVPQLIAGVGIVSIWNPIGMHPLGVDPHNWFAGRLRLFWWNWRELNRSELGALVLLAAAPVLFLRSRDPWLLRAPLALAVYVAVITLCSPQLVGLTSTADVRYLAPVIPLCIGIEALVLCAPAGRWWWLSIPLAALAFGTNLFNGGPLLRGGLRSTIASYAGELIDPPDDPFAVTAAWISKHLHDGQSVWVLPNHATYPLMFHAPKALYAWQLSGPAQPQFAGLAPINFVCGPAPDYLIAFGPSVTTMVNTMQRCNRPEVEYEPLELIDHYYDERQRPELFWHSFGPVTNYDRASEAIYIFKRKVPPVAD